MCEALVASSLPQMSVAEPEQHDRERTKAIRCHEDAVHNHVDEKLHREDTNLDAVGRPRHDIWRWRLEAQAHCGESRGDHQNPEDLNGADREDR